MDPFAHPYAEFLSAFKPSAWQLEWKEPIVAASLNTTPVTVVNSNQLLYDMLEKLKDCRDLAIDMLFDTLHSFYPKITLIEISTRNEDFIIDALPLKHDLTILNEVCAKADFLKVMRSNRGDQKMQIEALQRDFGVYIVNLFDIGTASRELDKLDLENVPRRTLLGTLLKRNGEFRLAEKSADCNATERPFSAETIRHVREETHYLLYLYDIYRNKLMKTKNGAKNQLSKFYEECAALCRVVWHPSKCKLYWNTYKRCLKEQGSNEDRKILLNGNGPQRECFQLLHDWRWKIAKERDANKETVLPYRCLRNISVCLPDTAAAVAAFCSGVDWEFPLQHVSEVMELVGKAVKTYPGIKIKPTTPQEYNGDIDTDSQDDPPKKKKRTDLSF